MRLKSLTEELAKKRDRRGIDPITLWNKGGDVEKIAADLGLPLSKAIAKLLEVGVPQSAIDKRMSKELPTGPYQKTNLDTDVLRDLRAGKTRSQLASSFKISKYTVNKLIKQHGTEEDLATLASSVIDGSKGGEIFWQHMASLPLATRRSKIVAMSYAYGGQGEENNDSRKAAFRRLWVAAKSRGLV